MMILKGKKLLVYSAKFLAFLLFIFFAFESTAQALHSSQKLFIKNSQLSAENGELISIEFHIQNLESNTFMGRVRLVPKDGLELVSKNEFELNIRSGQTEYYSHKVVVPNNAAADELLEYSLELLDTTGIVLEEKKGSVSIKQTGHVNFLLMQNSLQIRNVGELIVIPVRLQNTGNTDQLITVATKFPSLNQNDNDGYHPITVLVPAFKDTIIEINKTMSISLLNLGEFEVTLSCLYENGDFVGIGSLTIQSLRSSKKFNYGNQVYSDYANINTNHSFEVNGQYLFTKFETYQVRANSDILFQNSKGKINYSIDGQFWKEDGILPYFKDTYINYDNGGSGITVGNITRNYELNLIGRGISGYLSDSSHSNYFEAGAMDESYNLIQKTNFSGFENSKALWSQYGIKRKKFSLLSTFIHEKNTLYNEKNYLLSNEMHYSFSKKLKVDGIVNGGYSETLPSNSKTSFAAGINLEGNYGKLIFTSENYISSPFYPGIKRGSTIFSQRLTFVGNKSNLSFEYAYNRFNPQYLTTSSSNSSLFSSNKAEIGLSGELSDRINYSFNPIYFKEYNSLPYGANTKLISEINSLGAGFRLNYFNHQARHFLYVSTELGGYKAPLTNGNKTLFHLKTNVSYQLGIFSLNFYGQVGEFFAGEVLGRYFQNTDQYKMFNVSPMIQHDLFNKKLNLQAGVSINTSSLNANGFQVTGKAEYSFNRTDKLYASLMNYQYDYEQISFSDFRIGFIKHMPDATIYNNRQSLTIFLYKDINSNGSYEPTDSIADDYIINIGKEVLLSDKRGLAMYRKVPPGMYNISVPPSKGWYAGENVYSVTENKKIAIALQRNAVLRGTVTYAAQDGILYDVEKRRANIFIHATDALGKVYITKTTELGSFIFFIPPGQYQVEILKVNLPEQVQCNNCKQATNLEINSVSNLGFELIVNQRIYKVQKFVSPAKKDQ